MTTSAANRRAWGIASRDSAPLHVPMPRPIKASPPSPSAMLVRAAIAIICCFVSAVAWGSDERLVEFRGRTMGTTYVVKVFDPPDWEADIELEIEAELRAVNDQMSTYLESSEISRFNASDSTDWFSVSGETAMVVAAAQRIAEATEGAFDVTIGPLVDAWSFGPGPRTHEVPDPEVIERIRRSVGYQNLSVRRDPPELRKSVPALQVDLSAIAKGHGVDRVLRRLQQAGAENIFVEIGGEVRAAGDKDGEPWRVGVQRPDAVSDAVLVASPLVDQALATSGDYRNRFEAAGETYSHTIDPHTGAPIKHPIASVTVLAEDCMRADAWATAINALGREAGLASAREQGLDVLVLARRDDGGFTVDGLGALAEAAEDARERLGLVETGGENQRGEFVTSLIPVLVVTTLAFAILLAVMAVGVLFGRRSISGSCGGLSSGGGEGENCSMCGSSTEGCRELRDRLSESVAVGDEGNERMRRR